MNKESIQIKHLTIKANFGNNGFLRPLETRELIEITDGLLTENQEQAGEIKRLKNRIALFEEIRRLSTIEPKEEPN